MGNNKERERTKELEEITSYFSAIANPIRLGILIAMYGGEFLKPQTLCSLTFGEIKAIFGTASNRSVSYHIRRLLDLGLIEKLPQNNENGRVYPTYRTTKRGKQILEKLNATEVIKRRFTKTKTGK